jgi:hypothetical protein
MTEGELLERIARTLRKEIGPAVAEEYPKTQAFMAGVVAQKLGRQLDLAAAHASAYARELDALLADLKAVLPADSPAPLLAAVAALSAARNRAALAALIGSLYATRAQLGEARFSEVLGRIRGVLRADIDRRMEYSA